MQKTLALVLLSGALACGGEKSPPVKALPSNEPRPKRQKDTKAADIDFEPAFDVRKIRVDEKLVGSEQIIDVEFAGKPAGVDADVAKTYGMAATTSVKVTTRSPAGQGAVHVVFDSESEGDVGSVRPGNRIKVKIVGQTGPDGEGAAAAFVESLGKRPKGARYPKLVDKTVDAGFDFDKVESDPKVVGTTQTCGIQWVGGDIQLIDERDKEAWGFPKDIHAQLPVHCRREAGHVQVNLLFGKTDAKQAAAVRPGTAVSVEILARPKDEALGKLEPWARYVGPG